MAAQGTAPVSVDNLAAALRSAVSDVLWTGCEAFGGTASPGEAVISTVSGEYETLMLEDYYREGNLPDGYRAEIPASSGSQVSLQDGKASVEVAYQRPYCLKLDLISSYGDKFALLRVLGIRSSGGGQS